MDRSRGRNGEMYDAVSSTLMHFIYMLYTGLAALYFVQFGNLVYETLEKELAVRGQLT